MKDNDLVESDFEKDIDELTQRLDQNQLESMKSTSLGGAGLSTAIVLLLFTTKLDTSALKIALYLAAFGIPVWVSTWQMIEAYSFYGENSYHHIKRVPGAGILITLFLLGTASLFVCLALLIWSMSHYASMIFIAISTICAPLVFWHSLSVKKASKGEPSTRRT